MEGLWGDDPCPTVLVPWVNGEKSLIKSQRQGTFLTFSSPARGFDTTVISPTLAQTKRREDRAEFGRE